MQSFRSVRFPRLLAVPHAHQHQAKIFEYPQNEKKAILYLQKTFFVLGVY